MQQKIAKVVDYKSRLLDAAAILDMQFNVELSETDTKRIKKDAIELGVTLSAYATQAFQTFLAKPVASRRVYFNAQSHGKRMGRKIKS